MSDNVPAIDIDDLVRIAAGLLSEDGDNPEYDRALVEVCCEASGLSLDYRDTVLAILRGTRSATPMQYGVRCSGDGSVTWWPDVTTGISARFRFVEVEKRCEYPHLLVTKPVKEG